MKPMLQRNARYGLHEGRYEELSCQNLYGIESCSCRNVEPFFKNTYKRIQGNPCIKRIESTKVKFSY